MSVRVFYEILNQRGTPAMFTDTLANRPAFGFAGRLFISTDSGQIFEDTGSAWTLVADAGVGGGTLSSVCLNGNTTATGIVITAGGLSTNTLTNTSLTTGSILFADSGGLISQSNATFFWDNTNKRLGIGTASPGAPLDIHATGTNAQFNGTGSNNAYLQFQNAGTSKWRIGNTYNAGANSFDIYNNATTTNALSISSTSNNISLTASLQVDKGVILSTGTTTFVPGLTTLNGNANGLTIGLGVTIGSTTTTYAHQLLFPQITPQIYTFPSATGTIALTSQIPSLTGYVPYTGATTSLDLGTNSITAIQLIASASGGNAPSYLLYYNSTLYASISSTATYFQFNSNTSAGYLFKNSSGTDIFRITNSGQIGNGINTYTLPSSNGTLALTSDITGYLPLTGGTLTGQLYINPTNTATTGLDVASDNISFRSDNLEGNKRQLLITMGSGTLIKFQAQGYGANYGTDLAFYTATTGGANSTPAIYITGGNKVGILNGSPTTALDVTGTITATGLNLTTSGSTSETITSVGTNVYSSISLTNTTTGYGYDIGFGGSASIAPNSFYIYGGSSASVKLAITSGGVLCVGTTSGFTSGLVCSDGGTSFVPFAAKVGTTANATQMFFNNPNGAVGSITTSGSVTTYNVTSDYRLKQDFKNYNGLDLVSSIKTYDYEWKSDKTRMYGVMAHELAEVIPYAVQGIKDGKEMQGVDYSKIVPILVKAIQELNEKLIKNNIN